MTGPVDDEARLVLDRLSIGRAIWWGLHPASREAIRGSCLTKRVRSQKGARFEVRRLHALDIEVRAYRCPFARAHHWHVGAVVGMDAIEAVALAIRDLAGDRPEKLPNRG